MKNKDETDPQKIAKQISRGDFIIKELEALYRLKKYRYLKSKYYPDKDEQLQLDPKQLMKKLERSRSVD